jgi:hypothetical protein
MSMNARLLGKYQQRFLEQLRAGDIYVAYSTVNGRISKWYKRSVAKFPVDLRNVLYNEVVYDLDFRVWERVYYYGKRIDALLHALDIPHIHTQTGGKGVHISFFLDIDEDDRRRLEEVGVTWRFVRRYYFHQLLDRLGIPERLRGKGEPFDDASINFSRARKGRIIRLIGGRKFNGCGVVGGYCTYIDKIPRRRAVVTDVCQVRFPDDVEFYTPPRCAIDDIIAAYEESELWYAAHEPTEPPRGDYLDLPCIRRVLEGMPISKRNSGEKLLAIACRLSGLSYDEAMRLVSLYRARCEQDGEDFVTWTPWFYRQRRRPYWSCREALELGVCEPFSCGVSVGEREKGEV